MQIGELVRGFPELGIPNKSEKDLGLAPPLEILPIRESDKPYQFDFPKFDTNDIQAAIKRTIKEAVLGKLFTASETPSVGLLDGFNDNAAPVTAAPNDPLPNPSPVEDGVVSYSYSYSFSESLSLDLSIADNQLSLDLSFSRSLSEDISYINNSQGITYSSSSLFEKSLNLSLSVDLGEEGENPTLLSFELNKTNNRSFTETLTLSSEINNNDTTGIDDTGFDKTGAVSQTLGLNSELLVDRVTPSLTQPDDLSSLQSFRFPSSQIASPATTSSSIELFRSQQAVSYEKLLITQLQQGSTAFESPRLNEAANNLPASNAVIQEYLLGLR